MTYRPLAAVIVVAVIGLAAGCQGEGPPLSPGAQLYVDKACGNCHGQDREGKRTAPPLVDLESHWGEDELVGYLGNPDAVTAAQPRLQVLSGEYPHRMPPVPEADENDLRVIARYLLEPRADG